jgi:hypothetical protein
MANKNFDPIPISALAPHTDNHKRTSTPETSSSTSQKTQLPVDFQPSDYSVICGRDKCSYNHIGNRRFRVVANIYTERYSRADSKVAKTVIVSEIIAVIHQAGGSFCKFESGAWIEVEIHHAREKVSALLRDLLHPQYRSSAKAKAKAKRAVRPKHYQNQQSGQKRVEGTEHSDDSSTSSSCWGRSKNSLGFEYWLEGPDDFFNMDVF